MKKTFMAKKEDIKKKWYLVDAKDKILGRLAARVAIVLRGKHKPTYSPYLDNGDGVIVINAAKVKVTGRKMEQKVYQRYSGYPGGQREVSLANMLAKKPENVFKLAVRRMLSTGPLGREQIRKLKVYADDKHPHLSQHPVPLEV
ncbi:MAG: 50S ribosomal protein L13 [Candidatus Omnitrophica bacterium]|nr:50S ribosomal protein L13 [Candidatus Omnitrophota bacterium]MDD5610481.1 50S ribosomal protein L13 [Candidatus Omnitrophota bacterium]